MGFKVGDLITAYHTGIHRITEIERRFYKSQNEIPSYLKDTAKIGDEYSPLIKYEKVMDMNGNLTKMKSNVCDALHCHPVEMFIQTENERIEKINKNIKTLLS